MHDPELDEALAPVRHHLTGPIINRNTVLAAWMRSLDVTPSGDAWQVAKVALASGLSFREAASAAAQTGGERGESPVVPSLRAESSLSALESPVPERLPVSRPRLASVLSSLEWYPKVFGPGDIVGQGAVRLLGTPNIPLVSVLVRETAQNSWDARTSRTAVRFSFNLRKLDLSEREVLSHRIFTGTAPALGLDTVLAKEDLWVLEVADRGTKGLGGPVRNDRAVPADRVTDFIDLIFNIGAPRDVKLGAGTYGFGKSITYKASGCGTVLFWSRSREPHGIEDRLIGSAFGGTFVQGGLNHTGRHWWGSVQPDDQRIEPLVGDAAATLASAVFAQGFGDDETGTSMLILDPQLGGASRREDAEALAEAVAWNLWPKLMDPGPGRTRMLIEVLLEGEPLTLPDPATDPLFAGYADCLELIRAVQSGHSYTPNFFTEIQPIVHGNTKRLLGHLALSRYPYRGQSRSTEVASFDGPSSHVVLMRHDAELVVKYWERQRLESEGFQWAAVFKPIASTDNSFADAEPPAHDDWVPDFIQDKRKKSEVRVSLTKIRDGVGQFLAPHQGTREAAKSGRSVAGLADRLAGLVGPVPGSAPTRRSSTSSSRPSAPSKPQVGVVGQWRGPVAGGRRRMGLRVMFPSKAKAPAVVSATAAVGIEGSQDRDAGLVEVLGWLPDSGPSPRLSASPVPGTTIMRPGQTMWLIVDGVDELSVDVTLTAEAVSQ